MSMITAEEQGRVGMYVHERCRWLGEARIDKIQRVKQEKETLRARILRSKETELFAFHFANTGAAQGTGEVCRNLRGALTEERPSS